LASTTRNIAVFPRQKVSVWIKGLNKDDQDKSDRVENLHTMHGDEKGAGGEIWNSFGHHSFYVVFQRIRKGADITGVITGQIVNGDGYKVRLWQGNRMVAEQRVDQQQAFKFEAVPAGTYRLEAIGPSLSKDNINIDADHAQVTVNLAVP
jgi:hypothetical protein